MKNNTRNIKKEVINIMAHEGEKKGEERKKKNPKREINYLRQ